MDTTNRSFRAVIVATLVMMGLLAAMPLAASARPGDNGGPGNSRAAKMCQKDGWQMLVGTDGTTFANQGECVSYAARGGVIDTPTIEIGPWGAIPGVDGYCKISITVSGVADGSYQAGVVGVGTFGFPLVVSDGTGKLTGENVQVGADSFAGFPEGAELQAFVGSLVSAPSTVSC